MDFKNFTFRDAIATGVKLGLGVAALKLTCEVITGIKRAGCEIANNAMDAANAENAEGK